MPDFPVFDPISEGAGGLYFHIPFCKQACHYCDFHFSTSLRMQQPVLEALHRELELRHTYAAIRTLRTVYFGGGTPSLLEAPAIGKLLDALGRYFTLDPQAEITLEANPDDLSDERLQVLREAGVNRLSIGIQSFRDEDLKGMNRSHNVRQAKESVAKARRAGFENLTIDLIYGLPGLSEADWQANLTQALALDVPHVSAYCLTVEPRTALQAMVKRGEVKPLPEEQAGEQFLQLREVLQKAGYVGYEVSNFGKPGFFSRHNTAYWQGVPYLGIGPSAHSFDGVSRQWNVANNTRYIAGITQGSGFFEKEVLSENDRYNEYIMTGMRTLYGCSTSEISRRFGAHFLAHFEAQLRPWVEKQLVTRNAGRVALTSEGLLLADRIAADLFF